MKYEKEDDQLLTKMETLNENWINIHLFRSFRIKSFDNEMFVSK